jgi:hypothetical protein
MIGIPYQYTQSRTVRSREDASLEVALSIPFDFSSLPSLLMSMMMLNGNAQQPHLRFSSAARQGR